MKHGEQERERESAELGETQNMHKSSAKINTGNIYPRHSKKGEKKKFTLDLIAHTV